MNISMDELNILSTRHANSFESAQLRDKLIAEGNHFCSYCKTFQPSEDFPRCDRSRGGRRSRCQRCSSRKNKKRTTGFIAHGHRPEIAARWVEANRDKIRAKDRRWYAENKPPAKERTLMTPEQRRVSSNQSKRRNFCKRKTLGMGGRQANYMADASEFHDAWNAIKGKAA